MSNDDVMNNLLDAGRIRGETRMFLEGTKPDDVTTETAAQVCHEVMLYVKERNIRRHQVARDLNISPTTVSEALNGKQKGNWQQVMIDLDAWLDRSRRADANRQDRPFVLTEVAREMFGIAEIVEEEQIIGLIYSPDSSGIGKTMALNAIHREFAGSMLVTCDKMLSSCDALTQQIARAAGVDNVGPTSKAAKLYPRIVDKLKGTKRLLILDQIHNLRDQAGDKPFYILADLWEATKPAANASGGAPQLWVGTANLKAYFNRRAHHDESLRQIASRIAFSRDIMERSRERSGGGGEPLFTIETIRAVFGSNRIRIAQDGMRFLAKLACLPDAGGLRTADNVVRVATRACAKDKLELITLSILLAALKFTMEGDDFRRVTSNLEIEQQAKPRIAAAG